MKDNSLELHLLKAFVNFLKRENKYLEYRTCLANSNYASDSSRTRNPNPSFFYLWENALNDKTTAHAIIDHSFIWAKTPYAKTWLNLDSLWRQTLNMNLVQ